MATKFGFLRLNKVVVLVVLLLCPLSGSAHAQDRKSVDSVSILSRSPRTVEPGQLFADAVGRLGSPKRFVVSDSSKGQPFAYQDDDSIAVDRGMIFLLQTPEEALGLAVMLETYAGNNPRLVRVKDGVSVGEVGAGLLVGLVGSQLDKVDPRVNNRTVRERQAGSWDRQGFGWDPGKPEYIDQGRVLAGRALTSLYKAGGCSAPLIAILERVVDYPGSPSATPIKNFARSVLKNLGASIYPPDRSCLRKK